MKPPAASAVWQTLRRFTAARIALGRAGNSLPTQALLQFELAHAQARDAVYRSFESATLARDLQREGFEILEVKSQAVDRQQYLLRPDLGRELDATSKHLLQSRRSTQSSDIVFIIADGLAPQATAKQALPLLCALRAALHDWIFAPVVIAQQARVALSDEIGAALNAQIAVILIGERPGLSSPCSMGAYVTYAPQLGRSDAERNCVSNIHTSGLSCVDAAKKLRYLLSSARRLQLSGVALKDDSDALHLESADISS